MIYGEIKESERLTHNIITMRDIQRAAELVNNESRFNHRTPFNWGWVETDHYGHAVKIGLDEKSHAILVDHIIPKRDINGVSEALVGKLWDMEVVMCD